MDDDTRSSVEHSTESAARLAHAMLGNSWSSTSQARRVELILSELVGFARVGYGAENPASITPGIATAFVRAPLVNGTHPSVSLMHLRRSALRLMFRALRSQGSLVGDPTLDMALPPRSPLATRALTDDELLLCRACAVWSLVDSRRAAAWALAEASCRSVEIAQIRVADIDLETGRVWIHGGRTTEPRWGHLTDWARAQLMVRLDAFPNGDPEHRVVYAGSGPGSTGQISASVAISDVLTRAGLRSEPDVRPASVAAWAGRQVLSETGRIDEVARRLGMSSLDRTCRFIGFDWSVDRQ